MTTWVYPRVCGGTSSKVAMSAFNFGLSPRVRGNLLHHSLSLLYYGSIPAVCGGTKRKVSSTCRLRGLSPRVRGNLTGGVGQQVVGGSIPACAGEPM